MRFRQGGVGHFVSIAVHEEEATSSKVTDDADNDFSESDQPTRINGDNDDDEDSDGDSNDDSDEGENADTGANEVEDDDLGPEDGEGNLEGFEHEGGFDEL